MNDAHNIDELYETIIKDCYDFLEKYSSPETMISINKLKELNKSQSEILQKSYIILGTILNEQPSNNQYSSIFSFTKEYYNKVDKYLLDKPPINKKLLNSDLCNSYLALCGYRYIFNGIVEKDFMN